MKDTNLERPRQTRGPARRALWLAAAGCMLAACQATPAVRGHFLAVFPDPSPVIIIHASSGAAPRWIALDHRRGETRLMAVVDKLERLVDADWVFLPVIVGGAREHCRTIETGFRACATPKKAFGIGSSGIVEWTRELAALAYPACRPPYGYSLAECHDFAARLVTSPDRMWILVTKTAQACSGRFGPGKERAAPGFQCPVNARLVLMSRYGDVKWRHTIKRTSRPRLRAAVRNDGATLIHQAAKSGSVLELVGLDGKPRRLKPPGGKVMDETATTSGWLLYTRTKGASGPRHALRVMNDGGRVTRTIPLEGDVDQGALSTGAEGVVVVLLSGGVLGTFRFDGALRRTGEIDIGPYLR